MKQVAIIPVRSGSKGVADKNFRLLKGRALWAHGVVHAQGAGITDILVSTDVPDRIDNDAVTVLSRPAALAGDATPMAPVLAHALATIDGPARVVLLQATSPLRRAEDITAAITLHETGQFDLVMSVTTTPPSILKYGTLDKDRFVPVSDPAYCFANRQNLPQVVRPNGAVYVFDKDWFLANDGFVTDRIGAVHMPEERSLDIDAEADFAAVEALL